MREPLLSTSEVTEFLDDVFPQMKGRFVTEELGAMRARVRMKITEAELRPGGTVSGPSMFALADCAYYIVTMAMIGRESLTVTTNCNINFMRKPGPVDLIGEARILKLGRSLSVGEVTIFSDGMEEPVAHATLTYSIPPRKS